MRSQGVRWHLSYLFSLWPLCIKYLLGGWSTMRPFIPFLIVTSLYEVFIEWIKIWKVSSYSILSINTSVSEVTMSSGMKGITVLQPLNKYFIQWGHNDKRYERSHRPFTPLLIVTSLTEVFIERMEYDDTFHTAAHCDFNDWSIYWNDGVRWHLSYLFSLWVTMRKGLKGVIVLHPLNKYFIQWGHNEKRYERCHRTPSFQ
jgi:hypothetical protein